MDQSWKIPDCVQVPSHSQVILPAKDVEVCPFRLCDMNVLIIIIIPSVTTQKITSESNNATANLHIAKKYCDRLFEEVIKKKEALHSVC